MKKISLLFLPLLAAGAASAQAPDPSTTGPHAVTVDEYTQGDQAFTPSGFPAPVEFTAAVFSPSDLQNGPYPLVLYLHGRHSTCGTGTLEWPCTGGRQPIRSYRGYDYSAQQLASHGYIVVSASANGINAQDNNTNDLGAGARAELIDRHLTFWRTLNTQGAAPFGNRFVGRVDLTRVGTMGHSRGGEGTMRHFSFNAGRPSPFPLKVIVPIAPTNFSRWQVNDGVGVAQLLSYCDGDVNNIQGVHFFDDARYRMPSGGYQNYVAVMGANHNFFNTVWTPGMGPGASDDWSNGGDPHCGTGSGNGRLTAAQQRAVGLAYLASFFRTAVGGEDAFFPYVDGSGGLPPSVASLNLHVSYHGNNTQRRDLNRLLAAADLSTNFLGGASSQTGLTPHNLCGGIDPQPQHCLANQSTARMPHTAPSSRSSLRGLSQLRTGWGASGATYVNEIPAGPDRDVSGFDFLQFRTAVNFADTRNAQGQAQDFSVTFTDAASATQTLRVGQFSRALFFPPGTQGPVPKVWHNTVRLPLSSLSGVDRTRISRVTFNFNQRATGALLVSDLHFYRAEGGPPAPDFTIAATPASRTVNPGQSTTYTVNVASVGGFSGAVSLSASGLPAGATATFNPASVAGSGSSTLTVATAASTPTGSFTLTLTGTSGSLARSATVTLVVQAVQPPDFTIAATPASRTVNPGQNTTYTVNVGSVGGFSGTVSLSAGGLPAGATATFNPTSVAGSGSSTLTVATAASTPTGSFTLTLTGTSGAITHSTTVTLVVAAANVNFNVSVSPGFALVRRGASAQFTVTVTHAAGSSGTVALSASGLPAGATATFTPPSVTGGTSRLVVQTAASTPSGFFSVTIRGTSGSVSRTTSLFLFVQ